MRTVRTARPTQPPKGLIYVLWAEGTTRFKVGYTAEPTPARRALDLQRSSPFPLRIICCKPGTVRGERNIRDALRRHRSHSEWLDLPEAAVWWLLRQFGISREHVEADQGRYERAIQ